MAIAEVGFEPILPTKYLLFTTSFNNFRSNWRNEKLAVVKLRICTSSRIAPGPLAIIGDEVSHFYDILTMLNIFFKELFKSSPALTGLLVGLQFYFIYQLHCVLSFFKCLQHIEYFITPSCYQVHIITHHIQRGVSISCKVEQV